MFSNVLIFSLPKTMFKVYTSLMTHRDRGTQVEIFSNNFIVVLKLRVRCHAHTLTFRRALDLRNPNQCLLAKISLVNRIPSPTFF